MCSQEVLILVNQSIKDVEDAIISLLFSLYIYSCPQTPCANGSNNYRQLQIKSVSAYICLFAVRGLRKPMVVTEQRNTHVEVYRHP